MLAGFGRRGPSDAFEATSDACSGPDRVAQVAHWSRLVDTQPMTVTSSTSDTLGQHREPTTPTAVDAVCGDLTVTFDIRYIDGPTGDRLAEAQARAIYALLEWMAAGQAHHDGRSVPADRGLLPPNGAGTNRLSPTCTT